MPLCRFAIELITGSMMLLLYYCHTYYALSLIFHAIYCRHAAVCFRFDAYDIFIIAYFLYFIRFDCRRCRRRFYDAATISIFASVRYDAYISRRHFF